VAHYFSRLGLLEKIAMDVERASGTGHRFYPTPMRLTKFAQASQTRSEVRVCEA